MDDGYGSDFDDGANAFSSTQTFRTLGRAGSDPDPFSRKRSVNAARLPARTDRDLSTAFGVGGLLGPPPVGPSTGGHSSLAVERLVALLDEDTGNAFESFCAELADRGLDPQAVAQTLLEPAARSIGAAWCADTQDFMRVTFSISRLQRLFWDLASRAPPRLRRRPGKLALLAPAPGEQHTFGLSVVDDALRRDGWDVDCCGFGEEREMFRLVARNDYRFVGLSLSSEALLPAFASAIGRLRSRSLNPSIVVVAGGSLFQERPDLAMAAGADMIGGNARSILRLAEGILVSHGAPTQVHVAAE